MGITWKTTSVKGIRYREHPTRKHGVKADRYFCIRFQSNGKRVEESLGWASDGWTLDKATTLLAGLREAARKGEGPQRLQEKRDLAERKRIVREEAKLQEERENIPFETVWEQYRAHSKTTGKVPDTLRREKNLYEYWLKPVLANRPLKMIAPIDLERVKSNMTKAERAPRSVQYALAVVRQVFNYADTNDLYHGPNPARKVKIKLGDNRRQRFLSQEEAVLLLTECKRRSPDLHDMVLLSLHTGLRASEIFRLTWARLDFSLNRITVSNTKNGDTRYTYMTGAVRDMFLSRRENAKDGQELIFPAHGERVSVSNAFDRAVEALKLNVGISKKDRANRIVFHSLRHSFASWSAMAGTPMHTLAELMGHRTLAMTMRYSHLSPGHLQRAVKVFEDSLAKDNTRNLMEIGRA
jgi:integrase